MTLFHTPAPAVRLTADLPSQFAADLPVHFATKLSTVIPSPSVSQWQLGPLTIRAYALCILAGIFFAVWWTIRRYSAAGGEEDTVYDVALPSVVVGILGARLYHVITTPELYFGATGNPALIPQIWQGGLGIWGGVAAGVATGALVLKRKGLRLAPFADAVAPAILAAQAIGRLGNWFNQELFGAPTTLPWGLQIDAAHMPAGYPVGTLFHPSFLYELLWNAAGAIVLAWLGRYLLQRDGVIGGRLLWAYLMVYTSGRVWIEYMRIDTAHEILGLRVNVWVSIAIFAIGLVGFLTASKRPLSDEIR